MKKIIAIITNIVIICLNVFELIHAGFFRDAHPNINIDEVELYFLWGLLFLSIAFPMILKNRLNMFSVSDSIHCFSYDNIIFHYKTKCKKEQSTYR